MQRIAVARQRADDQLALLDDILERLQLLIAGEKLRGIAVVVPGIRAGADFDRLHALLDQVIEDLLERFLPEQDGENADPHADSNLQTVTQRRARAAFSIAASTR